MKNPCVILITVLSVILGGIVGLLFMCLLPIFLLILQPFHLFRLFVKKLAKCFRPDFASILTMRGHLISQGKKDNPLYNSMTLTITFESKLTIEKVKKVWNQKIINLKMENGQLRYPELQQYLVSWWGYLFWKPDKFFNLGNHIHNYEDHPLYETNNKVAVREGEVSEKFVHSKQLVTLRNQLVSAPFKKNQSPWEIIVLTHYKPKYSEEGKQYSAFIMRWHHSLGDGYSILKLFMMYLSGMKMNVEAKPQYAKTNGCIMFFKCMYFILEFGYLLVAQPSLIFDRNPWHLSMNKASHKFHLSVPDPIPLVRFKEVANAHGVTVSSVIQTAIGAGIRGMMRKRNLEITAPMQLAVPLPLPRHPNKLRNHATCGAVPFNIEIDDPILRLKAINKVYVDLKSSPLPVMNSVGAVLMGAAPIGVISAVSDITYATAVVSNFPGPTDPMIIFDFPCATLDCVLGPPCGNFGLAVVALSSGGMVHLTIEIEQNLLSSESEVEEFNEFLLEELQLLQSLSIV